MNRETFGGLEYKSHKGSLEYYKRDSLCLYEREVDGKEDGQKQKNVKW